ncbi:uncharacterized protein LOC121423420 [Lytechinus variegatus]|uniref:uncharacterized protein LOC121423420 n=1 Tax=Lytechinus variegatus TaxID=7654 RepID=UPI001BB19F39|nr:uncharacterized protein LOC121423420 [Lytechinus variegatus]
MMSKFLRNVSSKWRSYRYRFVPWVALNLKERTVRSVKNVDQDRIISDEEVEETYKKLFYALDDDLQNQDRRENNAHVLETENCKIDRSKVNEEARSYQDDASTKCNHHDNQLQDCQSTTALSPFHKNSNMFKWFYQNQNQKKWKYKLRGRERQGLNRFSNTYPNKYCKETLPQQLMLKWTCGSKEFFGFGSMDGDFRRLVNKALFSYPELLRSLMNINAQHGNCLLKFICSNQQNVTSHHDLLSVTRHPFHPQHHHCHYNHNHHLQCHNGHSPNSRSLMRQKSNPISTHSHQQSTSSHLGQDKLSNQDKNLEEILDPGAIVMHQTLGYAVGRRQSQIDGGGVGVYVTKGVVPKGAVVAMYPGTIYYPAEPILFQSIANPFVFRCLDGIHIDGNDKKLSKMIYRSCARRDRLGPYMLSDLSWLTSCPLNPMAVGQYVNNQHKGFPANVCYQEFDVPLDFPIKLRKYIPNAFFSTLPDIGNAGRSVRTVALVSIREIQCGEELLSSYFTLVY